ncbi:Pre-rRNA-processing protein las1 [Erysiphe neolycopersici]|uniref:Pre-rRNA-processing protein las1 n=1 Tax=Erysiphe neolycopersici TaxID=212602 RepID=A0A420I344_9PEZI|nr:Pre-rRNA-processing protein las1 [Erysiphe neolycopersici]
MVQYIITPWRNQAELLKVRSQFYHQILDTEEKINSNNNNINNNNNNQIINYESQQKQLEVEENEKKEAVARVRLWMQRGNCPHLIESTAILTSAILNDLRGGNESYCVRAVYAAAFSRFVTGLLDCHQEKRHKLSMYVIAKTIGLPATFVELRHQATHEELPSLIRLRTATQKALQWIWSYYWVNLTDISSVPSSTTSQLLDQKSKNNACQNWLRNLLVTMNNDLHAPVQAILNEARNLNKHWSDNCLLMALLEIQDSTDDVSILLHVAQLQAVILGVVNSNHTFPAPSKTSFNEVHAELESMKHDLCSPEILMGEDKQDSSSQEHNKGWALWDGPWIPKPIGII